MKRICKFDLEYINNFKLYIGILKDEKEFSIVGMLIKNEKVVEYCETIGISDSRHFLSPSSSLIAAITGQSSKVSNILRSISAFPLLIKLSLPGLYGKRQDHKTASAASVLVSCSCFIILHRFERCK